MASFYLSFLLLLYPIAWACAEGGNVISVTSEMVWYGILDLLAGPLFLFFFLFKLRGVEYAAFGLQSGRYSDKSAAYGETAVRPGVGPATTAGPAVGPASAAPGVTTGAAPVSTVGTTSAAPATTAPGTVV